MQPLGLCASLRGRNGNKTFDETRAMCVVFRRFTILKIDFSHWFGSPDVHISIIMQSSRTTGNIDKYVMVCCALRTQIATSFLNFSVSDIK